MMAAAGLVLAAAVPPSATASWHAVAGKLPPKYHLLETEPAASKNSLDQVCYGGVPDKYVDEEITCDDNSLTVFTLSHGAEYGLFDWPTGPDYPVTIRGRKGHWHWLQDDGVRYARELVWSPRPGLRVSVVAQAYKLRLGDLLYVGRHMRAIDERGWRLLLRQTTYEAQRGRFEPGMTSVEAASGRVDGYPWRLDVLIPPGYPLSENDLRPACVELVYRGVHGRAEFCPGGWRRIAGRVFILGDVPNSWRRYVVHFFGHVKGTRRGPTYGIWGWTKSKFYALPLPTEACSVYLSNPDDPEDESGPGGSPPRGSPDYKRCGFTAR
jgi:hypothetical protein